MTRESYTTIFSYTRTQPLELRPCFEVNNKKHVVLSQEKCGLKYVINP